MGLFNPEHKTKAHILEIILIVGAVGLTVGRMLMGTAPMTRADTMALGMGAKSLIIIAYQLLTEHVRKLARFYSTKACLILNSLEIVFWGAVVYMSYTVTSKMCPLSGSLSTSCILGWTVIALAVIIAIMSAYAAILSFIELRQPKTTPEDRKFENLADTFDDVQPLRPVDPARYSSPERNNDHYHNQYNGQQYAQYPSRPQY
ncbi:hypothetical protein F5X68DRAFT_278445 [Plectosphaerella plurivora]|uniref:Uncharacterized protein n=1 Tax=Plectosphaerella plurivora TaxID=936078 RepID=A0A9P8V4C3_9PEZI|nr:hypothetical protein F5X68DRAFT_278445 [Plectosphaerella plurivora]